MPRKSDDSDDEVLLLYAVGNKRERKWVQEVHIKRREFGEFHHLMKQLRQDKVNPLNPELNPICYLLALLAHHFLHVSRIMVKSLTLRLLMSYIYMERIFLMILDHTQRRSTVGRTPLDE